MLSLQLKSGDYITIGDDVVVQVFKGSGPEFQVSIKAPREIPIVRGKVLERGGVQRPDGLRDKAAKSPSRQIQSARRMEKLAQMREADETSRRARAKTLEDMRALVDGLNGQPAVQQQLQALLLQLEQPARR